MADLLVVIDNVANVVATAVVRFSNGHRVVGEVDIAVFAEEARHLVDSDQISMSRRVVGYTSNAGFEMEWMNFRTSKRDELRRKSVAAFPDPSALASGVKRQ